MVNLDNLKAILNIQAQHKLDYEQQRKLLESDRLEQILLADNYMRRDQVTLMLYQEGILEKVKK